MKSRLLLLVVLCVLLLGACSLAPSYKRPPSPVPEAWSSGATVSGTASLGPEAPWRSFLADEGLQRIIETALTNNRDLRLAALNVERTQALYGIARADLLPSVNVMGSGSKGRIPADLTNTGSASTNEQYSVSLGISSWEIDFFGRLRNLRDKALEEFLATDQARRGAQILLVSSVSNACLTLAADRETLQLAEATLTAQEEAFRIIQKRRDAGMASELDLRRAQSSVETARGDVARYTQLVAQDTNVLNLLVGSPVPAAWLPPSLAAIRPLSDISPGLSSELLLRRPDILAAEHRLKGTYANIGAARAAFFPRISLSTTIGTASAELSGLFKDGSSTWSFAPQIALPIFDARTWSAYRVTKVDRRIAVAQYEKAIQSAFREVADALAERDAGGRQIAAQESLIQALAETYRLARARYLKGMDSYLGVLDAQRSLYAGQKGLVALQFARIANLVSLYKVLGCGAS